MTFLKSAILMTLICFGSLTAVADTDDQQLSSKPAYDQSSEQRKKHPRRPKFNNLDLDGNESITLEEFKQHNIPRGDHLTVFNHIDADGNGVITQQEFKNHKPPRRSKHKRNDAQ